MKKRIALIESSNIGVAYSAGAVRSLGFEPVFLCRLANYQADARVHLEKEARIECDTTSLEAVVTALRSSSGEWAGVTSFLDTRLKIACEAAQALGIRGIDPAVLKVKDKAAVASLLPEFSPQTLEFRADAIEASLPHLENLLRSSLRMVVKPKDGAGALGVFQITSGEELTQLPARIAALQLPSYLNSREWVAQAYIDGALASVEGYALNGKCRFLGFTGRRKVRGTETGADFPADAKLPPSQRERAQHAVEALVERSGFRQGYFHIEFIFGNSGCWLIDANMARVGGGGVAEQLALSYDREPFEIFRHVIQIGLFGGVGVDPLLYSVPREETYTILYGLEHGGKVEGLILPPDSQCYHTTVVAPGSTAKPMGQDDFSWIGILSGRTADTLTAIDRIRIRTPEGEVRPFY